MVPFLFDLFVFVFMSVGFLVSLGYMLTNGMRNAGKISQFKVYESFWINIFAFTFAFNFGVIYLPMIHQLGNYSVKKVEPIINVEKPATTLEK